MAPTFERICLIAFFPHDAFFIPLSNLKKIAHEISPHSRSIITLPRELADRIPFDDTFDQLIFYKSPDSPVFRIISYLILNLKISWLIFTGAKDNDAYLFFIETGLLLPMIAAKLRGRRVLWLLPSSMRKMREHSGDLSSRVLFPVQVLSHRVADAIILYSRNLIREWELQEYNEKILIAHEHLINTRVFTPAKTLSERPYAIGYIGRLSAEKGVRNFVHALPRILAEKEDIRVLIGGDGPLREEIEEFIRTKNIGDRVHMAGWIAHDDLPEQLNRVQLLVMPSFTEGLPNMMLEAIACGTLVAATPVGAMPDIIRDGETGFILENNTPECIALTVTRALAHPDREIIARNARARIEAEFTLENTVNAWKEIFARKK